MSREFKHEDYKQNILRIKPEGWIDDLVFELDDFISCGQAEIGMGIRINNEAGGVLTLDDMASIIAAFSNHFEAVAKQTKDIAEKSKKDL